MERIAKQIQIEQINMSPKYLIDTTSGPQKLGAKCLTICLVYAAVAQEERRMISDRTKAGLAAARARGVVLGNPKLAADNRAAGFKRAEALRPVLSDLAGLSARAAAIELNKRAIATPTGAPWSAKTVIRMRERIT
jgi:DNA invertase Pin-like site-specific DNA recombinase